MTATCRSTFPIVQRALGANVRSLRAERGLSQRGLAEAAGVHERHVQRIETGRANPGISTLCLLADALGTTAAGLIGVDGERDPVVPARSPGRRQVGRQGVD